MHAYIWIKEKGEERLLMKMAILCFVLSFYVMNVYVGVRGLDGMVASVVSACIVSRNG